MQLWVKKQPNSELANYSVEDSISDMSARFEDEIQEEFWGNGIAPEVEAELDSEVDRNLLRAEQAADFKHTYQAIFYRVLFLCLEDQLYYEGASPLGIAALRAAIKAVDRRLGDMDQQSSDQEILHWQAEAVSIYESNLPENSPRSRFSLLDD